MKKFIQDRQSYVAEFIGTYFLVLCGTASVAAGSRFASFSGGPLAVAFCFGLVIMVMVFALGHVSGAHFNPAVSLGLYSVGRLDKKDLTGYLVSQFSGALLASLSVKALINPSTLGETGFSLLPAQAWGIEFLATFMLVFVVISVATDKRASGALAGVAIGGAIAVGALWSGPLTGGSMNPARSLAPALVSGEFGGLWVYLTAPFAGGVAAAQVYEGLRSRD
jgi:MIP family channel proteins